MIESFRKRQFLNFSKLIMKNSKNCLLMLLRLFFIFVNLLLILNNLFPFFFRFSFMLMIFFQSFKIFLLTRNKIFDFSNFKHSISKSQKFLFATFFYIFEISLKYFFLSFWSSWNSLKNDWKFRTFLTLNFNIELNSIAFLQNLKKQNLSFYLLTLINSKYNAMIKSEKI